ncbi:MAG TPA: hypothetical protein VNM40_02105 [Candidatus Paceibacterota bacterium]|nr:hypothetical protein [Candidatus Paceibacterota bacterium]
MLAQGASKKNAVWQQKLKARHGRAFDAFTNGNSVARLREHAEPSAAGAATPRDAGGSHRMQRVALVDTVRAELQPIPRVAN